VVIEIEAGAGLLLLAGLLENVHGVNHSIILEGDWRVLLNAWRKSLYEAAGKRIALPRKRRARVIIR
jgi:hypothetical protein